MTAAVRRRNAVSEFATGAGLLLRGMGVVGRNPRLILVGLVPGVIALAVVVAALVLLIYFIGDAAALVTWFAADWPPEARKATRVLAGVAVIGVATVVAVLTFTALTLTIGDPFYERISAHVDELYGG